jgi:hypothetical protein
MTTFIPRLLVAVVPFIALVAGIALCASRKQRHRLVLRHRGCRSWNTINRRYIHEH